MRQTSLSEQNSEDKEYWSNLGQFVELFSFIELQLFKTLTRFTGVSQGVARAVFSGVHIEVACSFLRRTMTIEWTNLETEKLFEILAQLKIITNVRNDIIHFGSSFDETGTRVITNKEKALFPKDIRKIRIGRNIPDSILADLTAIMLELHAWQMFPIKDLERNNPNGIYASREPRTWNYKPDAPPPNH